MPEFDSTVEYREIPDFPGYRVGNDGSIWSCLNRTSTFGSWGGSRSIQTNTWRRRIPKVSRKGYLSIGLCKNGRMYHRPIHRLVLLAFVGLPLSGQESRHFPDRSPANNSLANLSWGTVQDNQNDRKTHGTVPKGERHPMAKLTTAEVAAILKSHASGRSARDIGIQFKVTAATIRSIIRGKTWKHI